jgi:hypothetical protein
MSYQTNKVPKYLLYAGYMLNNAASFEETAKAFGVTKKQVVDIFNHSIKTQLPPVYHHLKYNMDILKEMKVNN